MQNIFSRKTKYLYIAWNEGTCLIFIWKLITDFYLPLRLLAYTRFLFTTILRTLGTHYMNRKIKGHPQRPLYAAPAWWGSTTAEDRSKHQRLHHKMQPDVFDVAALVEDMDGRLLRVVMLHDACVLYSLYPLPPKINQPYGLHPRPHSFELPRKDDGNFIPRVLYRHSARPPTV